MSKLISQVALCLLVVFATEINSLNAASAEDSNDSAFFRDGTLTCIDDVCEYHRASPNIGTAPSPKTIPEPSTVGAILAVGLGMLIGKRKSKSSQPH